MAYRYQGNSNAELVGALEEDHLFQDANVKRAFLSVPRASFLPAEYAHEAYKDRPLRVVELGFNVSAPHMYAFTLEHLHIQPGCSFLDVGSGCGLMTALGAYLAGPNGTSHGIDIIPKAVTMSRNSVQNIIAKGVRLGTVTFEVRNVFLPDKEHRKWDRIHVGAACSQKKKFYIYDLLKPGGILVVNTFPLFSRFSLFSLSLLSSLLPSLSLLSSLLFLFSLSLSLSLLSSLFSLLSPLSSLFSSLLPSLPLLSSSSLFLFSSSSLFLFYSIFLSSSLLFSSYFSDACW
eukprot:TRINITY_DN641_c0_g1_i4.p1 TRINITY_DN641_c0_g1~~TRINITY_DN641_c0_g1_i4.p1  ORF type:complete len:289 (+),score=74.74 TRINITY_DN641_c0_g1_i4:38-904(+)